MTLRTLPLFPLPLVLFPGVTLPLHIFESRYRRMLADCTETDRQFGITYLPSGVDEKSIALDSVGTFAHVDATVPLSDGRSNIAVMGTKRFAFRGFADSDLPYHVARIAPYEDEEEPAPPQLEAAKRVLERFARVASAARLLADDESDPPSLPDDPALLAFRIAALIDLDAAARQELLKVRSPLRRLMTIEALLSDAIEMLEQRAMVHSTARSNGRGPGLAS